MKITHLPLSKKSIRVECISDDKIECVDNVDELKKLLLPQSIAKEAVPVMKEMLDSIVELILIGELFDVEIQTHLTHLSDSQYNWRFTKVK